METPNCDYIISNPPYSLKGDVIDRLFEIGKPFAMLVGVVGLFESQHRFNLFKSHEFEIMYLNKRVSYFKDYAEQNRRLILRLVASIFVAKCFQEPLYLKKSTNNRSFQ